MTSLTSTRIQEHKENLAREMSLTVSQQKELIHHIVDLRQELMSCRAASGGVRRERIDKMLGLDGP